MSMYMIFKIFRTINTFGRDIFNDKITLKESDKLQSCLLVEIMEFSEKKTRQKPEKKQEKKYILNNLYVLFEGRKRVLDGFESKIFPIKIEATAFSDKVSDHSSLKILNSK